MNKWMEDNVVKIMITLHFNIRNLVYEWDYNLACNKMTRTLSMTEINDQFLVWHMSLSSHV